MRIWTAADQRAPPKGLVQDGWDGQSPESVKEQYSLLLVLKGAMNELLTNTDLPETQKEDLSALLQSTRLYRRADEHMELIAGKLAKNCLVLTSSSLDFVRLAIVLNRIGRCL